MTLQFLRLLECLLVVLLDDQQVGLVRFRFLLDEADVDLLLGDGVIQFLD